MEAARLVDRGQVIWETAPDPRIQEPAVLIRTINATICGSDLHNIFGATNLETFPCRYGYPGHESVGEVLESRVPGVEPGSLILSVPDLSCAAAFAELQVVPQRFIVPLPQSSLRDDLVLAQQLGTVIWALKRFWPATMETPADATATIIGAGTAGLFFVALLRRIGFGQIIVSDHQPERLAHAREMGASITLIADEAAVVEATMRATNDRGAELVVEAAGEDETREQALDAVREDGRVGFFGTPASLGLSPFAFNTMFRKKPSVECSHSAQHESNLASFKEAVRLIVSGELDVSRVITDRMEPDQVAKALDLAHHPSGGSLKVALTFT
jgi:threonine dehydrogenase-like Zn-dependent dehydrogenase